MKIKCTMSNTDALTVGKIYDVTPAEEGFSPTVKHDNKGFYYLNGKDNLSILVVKAVIAEFEAAE